MIVENRENEYIHMEINLILSHKGKHYRSFYFVTCTHRILSFENRMNYIEINCHSH